MLNWCFRFAQEHCCWPKQVCSKACPRQLIMAQSSYFAKLLRTRRSRPIGVLSTTAGSFCPREFLRESTCRSTSLHGFWANRKRSPPPNTWNMIGGARRVEWRLFQAMLFALGIRLGLPPQIHSIHRSQVPSARAKGERHGSGCVRVNDRNAAALQPIAKFFARPFRGGIIRGTEDDDFGPYRIEHRIAERFRVVGHARDDDV